jgi:MFS family permease
MSGPRWLLGLAAVAVAFAAADTYVVVLALPDMMASTGIPVDELQRAAPIVSGFLLGYVAMLPLIGRIADLRGRVPVLVAALWIFAVGSLLTTVAYDLPTLVAGRFLQGVGGGGLVPATLALVADLYPVDRRGVPLGVVSAVQELGSVLGPLFGALVLVVADWRAIFLVNLAVALVLVAAVRAADRTVDGGVDGAVDGAEDGAGTAAPERERRDWLSLLLALATLVAGLLVFVEPSQLMRDLTWGRLFIPVTGTSRWLTPLGIITLAALLLMVVRCCTARAGCAPSARPTSPAPPSWRSRSPASSSRSRRRTPRCRCSPTVAGGTSPGPRWPPRRSPCTCAAPRSPSCRRVRSVVRRPGARCSSASSSARRWWRRSSTCRSSRAPPSTRTRS